MKNEADLSLDYDYLVKVVMVGDSGVGKTCLMRRFTENRWSESFISTIGVDFAIKTLEINGKRTKLQIWDTAGQERFRNITSSYYRGGNLILVVFDVCSLESFNHVERWLEEVRHHAAEDAPVVLVANKIDMGGKRVVSEDQIKSLANKLSLPFMEASAKSARNVDAVFADSAAIYLAHRAKQAAKKKSEDSPGVLDLQKEIRQSSGCCR